VSCSDTVTIDRTVPPRRLTNWQVLENHVCVDNYYLPSERYCYCNCLSLTPNALFYFHRRMPKKLVIFYSKAVYSSRFMSNRCGNTSLLCSETLQMPVAKLDK